MKLAEDTDADKAKRIERLKSEQERISKEREAVQKGQIRVLADDSALEKQEGFVSNAVLDKRVFHYPASTFNQILTNPSYLVNTVEISFNYQIQGVNL